MILLTKEQEDYILEGGLVGVKMTIVPAGLSTPVVVESDDILEGSCVLDRNIISGSEFSVGNVEAAELTFILINDEGQYDDVVFEGARVTFEMDIEGTLIQMGVFTIDQRPTKQKLMQIKALDLMARFDRPFKKPMYIFPISAKDMVVELCAAAGVSDGTGYFPNKDVMLADDDDIYDSCTLRDVLSWIAGLAGANALITTNGQLRFRTKEMTDLIIPENKVSSIVTAESEVEITGVEFIVPATAEVINGEKVEIPELRYLAGDEGYTINLSDNPFIWVVDEPDQVLIEINDVWGGFSYLPTSNLTTIGFPHVMAGDIIKVGKYHYNYPWPLTEEEEEEAEGEIYVEPEEVLLSERVIYVTHHRWIVNGESSFKAIGETETEKGYASGSRLTEEQMAQIRRMVSRQNVSIADELSTSFEAAYLDFREEIANAMGFYFTHRIDDQGRVFTYIHDQPTLDASEYIEYKPGPGQFAWTVTGWNDGNPDWQYGISRDGNIILRKLMVEGIDIGRAGDDYLTKLTPSGWRIFFREMPVVTVLEDEMRIPKAISTEYFGVGRIKIIPSFFEGALIGTDIVFLDDEEGV